VILCFALLDVRSYSATGKEKVRVIQIYLFFSVDVETRQSCV